MVFGPNVDYDYLMVDFTTLQGNYRNNNTKTFLLRIAKV